ncbi:MAG: geranylgeranylglyceryl/heptaprenylglyceryl phosphate synthase [Candidatus Eisenbacteria bacterium]|nr:geranylgeranylglyceryl/heptaprenylglyceryl phosphate synthase [Candidatus Eisenbacteria bacterium]
MDSATRPVFESLLSASSRKGSEFLVLVDPDRVSPDKVTDFADSCAQAGVDAFLVGGSLTFSGRLDELISSIKKAAGLPVILFPGNAYQISREADAILFLSMLTCRNADFLVGEHVKAAPLIHRWSLEVIPTAYLLVESGPLTSVQFVTQSLPLPRGKIDLAVAHALAGKYMGMKLIFLEAGSGARYAVPHEMVEAVSSATALPVVVGGGIRTAEEAGRLARAGAKFVVVGNALEECKELSLLEEISSAVHFLER